MISGTFDFLRESLRRIDTQHKIPSELRSISDDDLLTMVGVPTNVTFLSVEPVELSNTYDDPVFAQERWNRGNEALKTEVAVCILTNPTLGYSVTAMSRIPGLGMTCLTQKIMQSLTVSERPIPIWIMAGNSSDESVVIDHVKNLSGPFIDATVFSGYENYVLNPLNDLALNEDGSPMKYSTGSGDLSFALQRENILERFIAAGGRYIVVTDLHSGWNHIDAKVLGNHIMSGNDLTCEIADRQDVDIALSPQFADGRVRLISDVSSPHVFTGNMIVNAETLLDSLKRRFDFQRFRRNRSGRVCTQYERTLTQLADWYSMGTLHVPHDRLEFIRNETDLSRLSQRLECSYRRSGT